MTRISEVPISLFHFDWYDYEVAFELRTPSLLSRIFRHKKEHLVFYIRRKPKGESNPVLEEILSWYQYKFDFFNLSKTYGFRKRDSYSKPIYWHNPTDAENFLTRTYLKLQPSLDNVVFSTASLKGLDIIRKALDEA